MHIIAIGVNLKKIVVSVILCTNKQLRVPLIFSSRNNIPRNNFLILNVRILNILRCGKFI